ncbi:insulinase family protein [Streptomyces sp. NPDC001508]|uniref:M16 family metallopeptidase n=1 Tax=Streptomyces sp. NPDC001508 TaxID=3154656 RepID=UPI0033184267
MTAEPPAWPVPPSAATTLPSGLRVLAVRLPTVPRVELRLTADLGTVAPGLSARASILAATLLRGLPGRDRQDIETLLGRLGCDLVPLVHGGRLSLRGGVLSGGLVPLLRFLAYAVTAATHPEQEVQAARTAVGGQLALARATPATQALALIRPRVHGDGAAGQEPPTLQQLAGVTAEQVRTLHTERLLPSSATLVLVGDLDPDATVHTARGIFDGWGTAGTGDGTTRQMCPRAAGATGAGAAGAIAVHPTAAGDRAYLCLGAPMGDGPVGPALHLANVMLGGFPRSRLERRLRDRDALAYTVWSSLDSGLGGPQLIVCADTAAPTALRLTEAVGDELTRLAQGPPDARQTAAVRDYAIGSAQIAWSSQTGLADALAELPAARQDPAALAARQDELRQVDAEALAEVCRRMLPPSRFTGVLVGPTTAQDSVGPWRLEPVQSAPPADELSIPGT